MSDDTVNQDSLRAEHMAQTRRRLVEAAIDVLCDDGVSEFSLRTVAKAAKVSAPTAYRHFPTTDALMAAVLDEFDRRVDFGPYPKTMEDLIETLPRIHSGFQNVERALTAYLRAQAAGPLRAEGRKRRAHVVFEGVERSFPGWSKEQVGAMATLVQMFVNSGVWDLWRNVWGVQGAPAGRLAAWALSALLREAKNNPKAFAALATDVAKTASPNGELVKALNKKPQRKAPQ